MRLVASRQQIPVVLVVHCSCSSVPFRQRPVHLARLRLPDVVPYWRGLVESQPSVFVVLAVPLRRKRNRKRFCVLRLLSIFKHTTQPKLVGLP